MDGLYVNNQRPKSKKQVKEAIAENPSSVFIEGTSMFGNPFSGPVTEAPDGSYDFVGPDPYTRRNFYGIITKAGATIKVK